MQRLATLLVSFSVVAAQSAFDPAAGLLPFKSFVVSNTNDSIPFDPYDFYGLRAALNKTVNSTNVLASNSTQAYQLFCNATSITIGNTTVNGTMLDSRNITICMQPANQAAANATQFISPIVRIAAAGANTASHPWRDACVAACEQNGHDGEWCFVMCDFQAKNDDGQAGNVDPKLVSACTALPNDKFAGILTTETAQIYLRIKNDISDKGGVCRAVVTVLQTYDWQIPVRQAQSSCKTGSKPSGVHFDYNQCVLVDGAAPYTIRYFDGPSIPHTDQAVQEIEKWRLFLPFGLLLDPPVAYFTALVYSGSQLVVALDYLRNLFWWAGVAHDFCYHNAMTGYQYNKKDCDDAFLRDCVSLCHAMNQGPLLFTSCENWADLFYWILRLQIDANIPFYGHVSWGPALGGYEASNYGYAYNLIDVVSANAHQGDSPVNPQPVPIVGPTTVYTLIAIQIKIFVKGDDKDPDTNGAIHVNLSNGETIALFEIPDGHWNDPSTHIFGANIGSTYTAAEIQSLNTSVVIDYITRGHDLMKFDMEMTFGFDKLGNINHCLRDREVGNCGNRCIFSCPTNACSFVSDEVPFAVDQGQC